jgi:GDP-4-dehydro-6-deoxy-D-mannose reductase
VKSAIELKGDESRREAMGRKALITGITGFVGSHLVESLLADGVSVVGLARTPQWAVGAEHLGGRVRLHVVELTDADGLNQIFRDERPDEVYHLAGLASVPVSIREPNLAWEANFQGSQNVYAALEKECPGARLLSVSSGTVYGKPPVESGPIHEGSPFHPTTPYSQSKLAADLLGLRLAEERGLGIFVSRSFNHIGPRQQGEFAIADFAQQIVAAECSPKGVVRCGNLNVDRDFLDVRDVVRAYRAMMEHAEPGEAYVLASGKTHSLRAMLDSMLSRSQTKFEVLQVPDRLRADDPTVIRVDPSKFQWRTGWKPTLPIEQTLQDVLDYYRSIRSR